MQTKTGTVLTTTLVDQMTDKKMQVAIRISDLCIVIRPVDVTLRWGVNEDACVSKDILVEYFDGKLQVHAWDGTTEDPNISFPIAEVTDGS